MHGPVAYVLILLAVAVLSIILAAYSITRRRAPGSLFFGFLMIAAAFYAGGYALELSSQDLTIILRIIRVEYIGIATLPAWWILFALHFSGRKISFGIVGVFLAVPIVTLVLVWTMDFHSLYYVKYWMRTDGLFPVIGIERGPWYWVNTAYLWICLAAGNLIMIRFATRAGKAFRRQARLAAVGSLAPWVSNLIYLAGFAPWGLDPSSFAVAVAGSFFAWAMFRHGFLDLIPVARERVLETMREGVVVADEKKRVVDINQAAREVLGLGKSVFGRPLRETVPEREDLAALLDAGKGSVEFSLTAPDGTGRRFRAGAFDVLDDRGGALGTALILNDISEAAALMERLTALAGTDELTKAFNRRRFLEYGEREMAMARRMGRPMTVIMLDLDHFKRVNDSYGHAAGDRVLCVARERLQEGLRGTDLLCRYGGEEFALLLPETEPERGQAVAERLRAAIAENPVAWEGTGISFTASFGVFGSVPGDGASMESWLRQADQALYASKANGRNRVTRLED
jgi:diguanylate cyclase (GGDEF)-like protein